MQPLCGKNCLPFRGIQFFAMRTFFILFSMVIFPTFIVNAGKMPTRDIWGKVIDRETQQALSGVNICLPDDDNAIGTITNLDGEFRLWNIPFSSKRLQVTANGYETVIVDIEKKTDDHEASYFLIELTRVAKESRQVGFYPKKRH